MVCGCRFNSRIKRTHFSNYFENLFNLVFLIDVTYCYTREIPSTFHNNIAHVRKIMSTEQVFMFEHLLNDSGHERCRLCLASTAGGFISLGDVLLYDDGQPLTVSEIIYHLTSHMLEEEQMLPGGVCTACCSKALAAYKFRQWVLGTVHAWEQALSILEKIPTGGELPQSKSARRTVCLLVGQGAGAAGALGAGEQPRLEVWEDPAPDVAYVLDRLSSAGARRGRGGGGGGGGGGAGGGSKRSQHGPGWSRALGRGVRLCACDECGSAFHSPYYLNLHLKNSAVKEACSICGAICRRGAALAAHGLSAHGVSWAQCAQCPRVLATQRRLREHERAAHAGQHTCLQCGRTLPTAATLSLHREMHVVRVCRRCGRHFESRACYRRHRARCEPGARSARDKRDPGIFVCDYCNKTYRARPQLKNHILWIHMDHRPHQCSYCGKTFYTAARLTEHQVVHTRERRWECAVCGARLVCKAAHTYHMRTHTGHKPYKCTECDEKFVSASRRSEHAKRRHGVGRAGVRLAGVGGAGADNGAQRGSPALAAPAPAAALATPQKPVFIYNI